MPSHRLNKLATLLKNAGYSGGTPTGVCADSRLIKEGDLFFALKGERVDGHQYLLDVALKKGNGAVVSLDYKGENFGLPLLYVENVQTALQDFARDVFNENAPIVVGVTGSVGKTTTKEFIAHILEGKYRVAKTPGNANSQVGLPLSLLNGEGLEEVLVAEMSMSNFKEIEKLVSICPPDIGVITKIGLSHALFFKNGREDIARAKAEILSHLKTRIGVAHIESKKHEAISFHGPNKMTYVGSGGDYELKEEGDAYYIREKEVISPLFTLPFNATHMCDNFLLAVVVARKLGMDWDTIFARALTLKPYKMRFEKIEREGVVFINDSYNASPESTRAALLNLPKSKGKKVFVFGEMKELGDFTEASHKEVAELALQSIDHLLCFGKGCTPMLNIFLEKSKPAELFNDFTELKKRVLELIKPEDLVLIKGSNSNALWRILE